MSGQQHDQFLGVWVAISFLLSFVLGIGAGVLGWLGGQAPALAVLTGGMAFGGALTLALLVIRLLRR